MKVASSTGEATKFNVLTSHEQFGQTRQRRQIQRRKRSKAGMLEEVGHFSAAVREVIRKAEVVFGDQKIADRWLNHSRNQFGGKAPLEMIATASGRKAVITLLNQIDHGMFT